MNTPVAGGPIFIVGFPRSGTTLIRALLSAHSTIAIAPETHFLNKFAKKFPERDLKTLEQFDRFWARFVKSDRFADIGIDAVSTRNIIVASGDLHLKNVLAITLQEFARKAGKPRWGEKTPAHDRHIGTLLEWYPDSSIIYMVRDPRAACASLLQAPWRTKARPGQKGGISRTKRLRLLNEDAFFWRRSVDRYRTNWEDSSKVLLVRYEDLVGTPEDTLRRVCDFIGAEFEPPMLAQRSMADVPPVMAQLDSKEHEAWRHAHIAKARQSVSTDAVDKWKKQLSALEIAVIEANCHREMHTLGYYPDRHDASATERLQPFVNRMVVSAFLNARKPFVKPLA
jgi:hypothetical protein